MTISSWLNFGHPAPSGRASAAGHFFWSSPYHSQRAVFASLWALVSWIMCCWAHGLPTIQCLFCRICKIFCYYYCNDLLRKIVLFRYLGLSAKSYLPDRGLLHFEAILASFYRLGLSVGVNGLSQFWMKIAKWKTPHICAKLTIMVCVPHVDTVFDGRIFTRMTLCI